jgi:hypothetical protein
MDHGESHRAVAVETLFAALIQFNLLAASSTCKRGGRPEYNNFPPGWNRARARNAWTA